jgi:holo-[acyl-carrier protein] synthase
MERAIARTPRIVERVFTSGEREYAWSRARPAVHYATFFAAREAVLKALGSGFAGVNFADVEITHASSGKPEVVLHGNASALAQQQGVTEVQISLSHTHQMAVASAVAIKAQSSPPEAEISDPLEELARQFKELRSLLDDLGVNTAEATAEPDGQEHE